MSRSLKSSASMYRTFDNERYENWCFGWKVQTLDRIADALRSSGIKCRRLSNDLFVRQNDIASAAKLLALYPDKFEPEIVEECAR